METALKISIIMPTYNRGHLIAESVESIRKQTYRNWELIIIDDGSDDDTEKMILNDNDGRIQFHKAGRTGIGGKIKNIGLEKASGELIAFIDSDDLWAETKLEKQVAALIQYPEAGFCLTGGYNFRNSGEPVDFFYKQQQGELFDSVFIAIFRSEIAVFTQALLLRKQCIEVTGSFKEEKSFSDVDFILSLASHFKAVILYEPLVYRRLHNQNYITSNWSKSYNESIEMIRGYRHRKMITDTVSRNALFNLHINFGEKCLKNKLRRKAAWQFFKAWINKPLSIIPVKKIAKSFLHSVK
ncbi:MAG: glycosyltransferase family 2 protein [Ferruginibacter sp.]